MTKQQLIEAALQEYSNHGYDGATMKKIASTVGIKPSSIYFFYENKEQLFLAAFQQLLNNHQNKMENVFEESKNKPIEQIFTSMIDGIVYYHKGDEEGTMAYISLVTSPIPGIRKYLHEHMLQFNDWFMSSLEGVLEENYPTITKADIEYVIEQYLLLANGVFWSINLYEGEVFEKQVVIAKNFITDVIKQLNVKYSFA